MKTWVLALCTLTGCQLFVRQTASTIGCRTNSECATGEVCFFRRCIEPEREVEDGLIVEITPPVQITQPQQQREFTAPRGRATINWATPTRVRVEIEDHKGNKIYGHLLLRREGLSPSREISYVVPAPAGFFDIYLEAGDYEGTVIPAPDLRQTPIAVVGQWSVDAAEVNLTLPYPSTRLVTVSGRLMTTPGDALFPGFSGASVYAKVTGDPLTSSIELSGSDGQFQLGVLGVTGAYSLTIGPSDENESLPEITFTTDADGNPLRLQDKVSLGKLYLGNIGSPFNVGGTVLTADGVPVADANVTAVGTLLGGVHRATATTNNLGQFELTLLRGSDTLITYDVSATARINTQDGSGRVSYALPAQNPLPPLSVTLGRRQQVLMTVKDAQGRDVPGASAIAVSAAGERVAARGDSLGIISMFLDPGDYTVAVSPLPGSRIARASFPITVAEESTQFDFALPPAALIAGEVKLATETKLTSATIEWYRVIGDTTELVGVATVDDENHFSVALPAK